MGKRITDRWDEDTTPFKIIEDGEKTAKSFNDIIYGNDKKDSPTTSSKTLLKHT